MNWLLVKNFLNKNKKVILIIILLIVLAFVVKWILKKIKESKEGNIPQIDPVTGGVIPTDFNPDTLARRFEDKFIGLSGDLEAKNEVLREINELNDNTLISLVNHWNSNYKYKTNWGFEYGSMYEVLTGEFYPWIVTGDTVNYFPLVEQRLIDLNLL